MNIVPLSGDFSFSLWFNASAFLTNISEFITNPNQGLSGISIGLSGNGNSLVLGSPTVFIQNLANYSFQTNQWNHIVISRQSGAVNSWINGVNQGTSFNTSYDFSGPLAIAWNGDTVNDKSFIGTLDEIGIWNRALINSEVGELYNRGFGLTYPFIIPSPSGCTDNTCLNYNPYAIYDDGSCIYPAYPSSPTLIPVNFFQPISTLAVSVGTNTLYPSFSAGYQDYCIQTTVNEGVSSIPYTAVINGNTLTGAISSNQALQIFDGTTAYYVRFLPKTVWFSTAIPLPTTIYGPASGYVDGYYLTTNGTFYAVYNKYGVPVWYTTYQPSVQSLEPGRYANRLVTNGTNHYCMQLNGTAISAAKYNMLSDFYGFSGLGIDGHEAVEIAAPPSRVGNMLYCSNETGIYVQEQSANRTVVWEFSGANYFSNIDPEYYHQNSYDVHPITGDYLMSFRHPSAIICVDYATKNIKWVMQGQAPVSGYKIASMPAIKPGGPLTAVMIPATTSGAKILNIFNEPTIAGYQQYGTCGQHDAKWCVSVPPLTAGNVLITAHDNETGYVAAGNIVNFPNHGPQARGVLYEIDPVNGNAFHRSSIYTGSTFTGQKGSYKIIAETDGSYTHQIYWNNLNILNPASTTSSISEYKGAPDGPKTLVFAQLYGGAPYRVIKVPPSFFRLDNLRATCGIVLN